MTRLMQPRLSATKMAMVRGAGLGVRVLSKTPRSSVMVLTPVSPRLRVGSEEDVLELPAEAEDEGEGVPDEEEPAEELEGFAEEVSVLLRDVAKPLLEPEDCPFDGFGAEDDCDDGETDGEADV